MESNRSVLAWILRLIHGPAGILILIMCLSGIAGPAGAGYRSQTDDSLAQALVRKHIRLNAMKMSMPGYRVQIYYGGTRMKATEIKSAFMRDHPGVATYLVYQQPNFKVRVGDFETRMDALRMLDDIQGEYPAAFVVADEVSLPDLSHVKE